MSFMGTMNYMRSFIYKFAEISAPLYDLLKKNVPFVWTDECKESFQILKTALTKAPILAIPDVEDKLQSYEAIIDSSKKGHAAVLTQIIDGERKVVSYFSKGVPAQHKHLGPSRLEFLGLYYALKHWKLLLQGGHFCVITDCKALLNLETIFKNESSFFQRRLAELSGFRFTIKHVSGQSEKIKLADFLSRYPFEKSFKSVGCQATEEKNVQINSVIEPENEQLADTVKHTEITTPVEIDTISKIRRTLEIEEAKVKKPAPVIHT